MQSWLIVDVRHLGGDQLVHAFPLPPQDLVDAGARRLWPRGRHGRVAFEGHEIPPFGFHLLWGRRKGGVR